MLIRLDAIPEEGLTLDLEEDGARIVEYIAGADFSIPSPVKATLTVRTVDGDVYIEGEIRGKITFECGRCLKEFLLDIRSPVSLFFSRRGGENGERDREKELKAGDLDVIPLEGPEIDTNRVIAAQISMDMPMKPLCVPDCKGLCHKCGADLNKGECGCGVEEHVDQRFAKLKDFKVK
ncbi:MAG: DUF177 domain-containing protein [Thermodesulfobacteriota bacterium]